MVKNCRELLKEGKRGNIMDPTTLTPTGVLMWLVAGVFLLLYGVRLVSDALQRVIRGRMQVALVRLSKYPLAPFGIGLVGTALMQSSSAVATLLVELVSTGLFPLSMAIVMVLGANVGATLVVQLLALHITDYALEFLGLTAAVALFTHRVPTFRRFGRALFAFALILLGLAAIGIASHNIAESEATRSLLRVLENDNARLVLVLIGTLLAIVLNSSTAAIGLVLTLAGSGALQPTPALVLVLGANVGTTLLSMLASLYQGTLAGRRLALVHTGTKLLGAVLLLLLIDPLATLLQIWPHDPGMQVSLTHIGFNLALALLFVPLAGPLASLMERLLPEPRHEPAAACSMRTLDLRALAIPEVAQGLATRETLRMADIVTQMFELSMRAFEERPHMIYKRMNTMEDQLDELDAAIKGYLTQLNEEVMTEEEARLDMTLLTIVDELEAIGDVITKRFMGLARRRLRSQIQFSEEGWEDLLHYHKQVEGAFQQVLAALAAHNPMMTKKFLSRKAELKRIKQNLHLRHIRQLRADIPNSKASSAVYLDLLDAMSTVLEHTFNIAYALQERSSQSFTSQFRSLRTGSLVTLNLTNTRPLNGTNTQQLYGTNTQQLYEGAMDGKNTQQLYEGAMDGKNTQQLCGASQTDRAQVSEW
jgi:phosphate:Na+ symporter